MGEGSEPREKARARGPSRLRRSLARSRETRFTRPNRRACSQAISSLTLVHSLSSQDLFPYDHYPTAKTAKKISPKWNNSLLIRLGRNYGTKLLSIPDIVYPQFTVARKTCAVLSACRKRHCRGLRSRWKLRETEKNACKKSIPPPSLCRVTPEDE